MTLPLQPFKNRHSVFFIVGLCLSAGVAISVDGFGALQSRAAAQQVPFEDARPVLAARDLSPEDLIAARTAWTYFEKNYRPETGLVDSVAGFPSGTLWDQGSYIFALISARRLGIITASQFDARVNGILQTLGALELFDGKLPNKVYNTQSLGMVDYSNTPQPDGIGWSALDVCRMLMALRVLERRFPEYGPTVQNVLSDWDLGSMAKDGRLWGTQRKDDEIRYLQEGRMGYEQYAARAAGMWGLDVNLASSAQSILGWSRIDGVQVPIDLRTSNSFHAITPTLSEPYILMGLEMGFDSETAVLANRVYSVQEQRFHRTGIPTMVSEDNIDQEPYFLYSSVHSNGRSWAVVSESGEHYPELRTTSLKTTFGWNVLYGTSYTERLREDLTDLATGEGWASGLYEVGGTINTTLTLNTNAVVLQSMHYKRFGPLWTL